MRVSKRVVKSGVEVFPKFRIKRVTDLMIRGGDFYAIWDAERGLWSKDEADAVELIDEEIRSWAKENADPDARLLLMEDADSGMIDRWHKYCQRQMRDSYHDLDDTVTFSDTVVKKETYASKRLPYPLKTAPIPCYDELMSTLYSEDERRKIEWAIGAVVAGDAKNIQKFLVLYGAAGTGKSTVLNIIEQLFDGYYATFDSEALGSTSNAFSLEAFKSNPLVGIEHEGNLAHIETNTRINSLVSHEAMTVNEKFRSAYTQRFRSFLFIGTNKPVRITDAKSGLIRRLIDVNPSGNRVPYITYRHDMAQIKFELGGIAAHCLEVYKKDPRFYDDYIPLKMLSSTNDFYNYVMDVYDVFRENDETTLRAAYDLYRLYCDDAKVPYPYSRRIFKEELKNYFKEFYERGTTKDGIQVRSLYKVFNPPSKDDEESKQGTEKKSWIELDGDGQIFASEFANCPAQYATKNGTPSKSWESNKTKLSSLDQTRLHYIRVPEKLVVIDFDIPDKNNEKDLKANLKAAESWPPTYLELSKSGKGVHLHYWYDGDVSKLARIFNDHIEIKVFTGKSSLRRMVTKTNSLPIAHISSGLPIVEKRGGKKVVGDKEITSEKGLRKLIIANLNKEYHPATKPSVDFIKHLLDEAYDSGLAYDISDMSDAIYAFCLDSTHNSKYCLKQFDKMHFKSEEPAEQVDADDGTLMFFDVEVYQNLFVIVMKPAGEGHDFLRLVNPSPEEVNNLRKFRWVGFNNKRYDNLIMQARIMGYTNEMLYQLSQDIIAGKVARNDIFRDAINLSYTDVYDFCSKKQSLKKWEIELGIHHQEMSIPWDEPVPDDMVDKVVSYCCNDVAATEAVFNDRQGDFNARKMLVELAEKIGGVPSTVNDSTNQLTQRLVFGRDRNPQSKFNYRDLSVRDSDCWCADDFIDKYLEESGKHEPYDKDWHVSMSGRPYFPGYSYEKGVSIYRGDEIGEGGLVYADSHQVTNSHGEPMFDSKGRPITQIGGIYYNIDVQDVASMHPHSIIAENLFGPYTERFKMLVDTRIHIKRGDLVSVAEAFDGALKPYIQDKSQLSMVAFALKIAINSVYGQNAAKYPNPFRDERNRDNIVAKRGALFMQDVKYAVQKIFPDNRVVHIKTDSIKIENTTKEIVHFVREMGRNYGYSFETENRFCELCLVNNAVYIAQTLDGEWEAVGLQFQVPYVYKTLFSHDDILFNDLCWTFSTKDTLYLDRNEGLPDVSDKETQLEALDKVLKLYESDSSSMDNVVRKAKTYDKRYKVGLEEMVVSNDSEGIKVHRKELVDIIATGHNYQFVGRVGQFAPVIDGADGGHLYILRNGKYVSPSRADGYRWLESENIRMTKKQDLVDRNFFNDLVNEAKAAIEERGDYEAFANYESIPF
jgi:hypothetical protein